MKRTRISLAYIHLFGGFPPDTMIESMGARSVNMHRFSIAAARAAPLVLVSSSVFRWNVCFFPFSFTYCHFTGFSLIKNITI